MSDDGDDYNDNNNNVDAGDDNNNDKNNSDNYDNNNNATNLFHSIFYFCSGELVNNFCFVRFVKMLLL